MLPVPTLPVAPFLVHLRTVPPCSLSPADTGTRECHTNARALSQVLATGTAPPLWEPLGYLVAVAQDDRLLVVATAEAAEAATDEACGQPRFLRLSWPKTLLGGTENRPHPHVFWTTTDSLHYPMHEEMRTVLYLVRTGHWTSTDVSCFSFHVWDGSANEASADSCSSSQAIICPGHPTHLLREKFSRAGGLPSTFVHRFDLPIQKPSPAASEADKFSFHTLTQIKTSTSHSTFYWSLFIIFSLDGVQFHFLDTCLGAWGVARQFYSAG